MKSHYSRAGARGLIYTLILSTTMVCSLKSESWAMLAPSEIPASTQDSTRSADMKIIQGTLESKILRERLKEHGLTETEINSRLSRLSDRQVHQFASRIHTLNPGGDFPLFGILLLVAVVLFIIYLVKRI